MYRHHNVFLPIASLFICVPEQALGWFPLGLGLVMEDELAPVVGCVSMGSIVLAKLRNRYPFFLRQFEAS